MFLTSSATMSTEQAALKAYNHVIEARHDGNLASQEPQSPLFR